MKKALPLLVLLVLGVGAFFLLRSKRDADVVGSGAEDGAVSAPRAPGAVAGPERRPGAPRPADGGGRPAPGTSDAGDGTNVPGDEDTRPLVEGVVVADDGGAPVVGAAVIVLPAAAVCPRPLAAEVLLDGADAPTIVERDRPGLSARVATDEHGRFAVRWGGPHVDLLVRGRGFVVGTACDVAPGAATTVRLVRGASITGVVVTPDGKPVAGARVDARPPRGLPPVAGRVERATSDADGAFAVEGLLAEVFDLTIGHPNYLPEAVASVAANTRGLRVTLRPAFVVTFQVTTEDRSRPDSPTVEWTAAGTPKWAGLELLRDPLEMFDDDGMPPPAPTAPDDARPPPLPPGTFRYVPIRVPAGRPTVTFAVKAVGLEPWTSEPVEVPPEGGATTLEVSLRRDPNLGRATITAEDREHRELSLREERCAVALGRRDGKSVVGGAIHLIDRAASFPALDAGPWRFLVRSPKWAPAVLDLDVRAGADVEGKVTLGPPAKLHVRFLGSGTTGTTIVRFRLVQGRTPVYPFIERPKAPGDAPSDAAPGDDEGGEEQAAPAGPEGVLLTGLAAGRHGIEVLTPDLVAPPTSVDLVEGETRDVEITVAPR